MTAVSPDPTRSCIRVIPDTGTVGTLKGGARPRLFFLIPSQCLRSSFAEAGGARPAVKMPNEDRLCSEIIESHWLFP